MPRTPGRNVAVFSFTEMADEGIRAVVRRGIEIAAQIASHYDSAYASFGTTVPEPADDEPAGAYRRAGWRAFRLRGVETSTPAIRGATMPR